MAIASFTREIRAQAQLDHEHLVRAFDAGPIENSRIVEQLTALLVSLNIRYGVKTAGLRITGVQPKN